MNYIIHPADDTSAQIHTCCRHADPNVPCAPECLICAASWPKLTLKDLQRAFAELQNAGIQPSDRTFEEQVLSAYVDADYEPETCGADCPWHGVVADLESQVDSLRRLLANSIDPIAELLKVLTAAKALAKEANYLHPFSLEVGEKVSGLQRAVAGWNKYIDSHAPKS